jgi:hypothetical protein
MPSVLKLSLAAGLFGLVSLGAILSWYFWNTTSSLTAQQYYFAGTDSSTGSMLRLRAYNPNSYSLTRVDYEVYKPGTDWQLWRSQYNTAESDTWFGLYSTDYSAPGTWVCTGVGNGNRDGNTNGASTFSQLGKDLATTYGVAGGVTYFQINDENDNTIVSVPVAFGNGKISNFGGYAVTDFSNRPADYVSFQPSLASPSLSLPCYNPVADDKDAVVESNTAPLCSSWPSMFAFLQKRVYADLASTTTWCGGASTEVTCSPSVRRTDTLFWKGIDRAFRCTSTTYGTILTFSGSDDVIDWLRNVAATTRSVWGMTAHNGFYTKFALWQSWIDSVASSSRTTFNGHSLGGAIANMAAVYWKTRFSTANVGIVTSGAPSSFRTPHTSLYMNMVNRRYVNKKAGCGFLVPNQRDQVTVVADILGFAHPSSATALIHQKTCSGWSTADISVIPIIGDVNLIHGEYPLYSDGARPSQTIW